MTERDLVIITGSTGFIGSAIVKRLAARFALVGFDKIASHTPPPAAECICIDLTSEQAITAAFERVRIAYGNRIASVVHLAAYYDLSGAPNPLYDQITVQGTARLLEHLQAFEVEQFIFSSTMLVHAPSVQGEPINEDSPLDPRWPYPTSKVQTEALIRDKRGDIPVVIMRFAGVYDDLCHSAFLAQQIARINERQRLSHLYPGDIYRGQSALHLDDATNAIMQAVQKRKELPKKEMIVLIGEPETLSYDEVQRTAGHLLHGEDWQTREIPKVLAKTGAWLEDEVLEEEPFIKPWMIDSADDHYQLNITRAETLLGWHPRRSLRETLPKIIEALKTDPVGWYRANKLDEALVAGQPERQPTPQGPSPGKNQLNQVVAKQRSADEHEEMMIGEHRRTLWAHFVNIALGAWLVTTPFAIGLFDHTVFGDVVLRVTAERNLAAPAVRNVALAWSDIASGGLVVLFGLLSLNRRTNWSQWANTLVGLWLLLAPLVFWAPEATSYINDTLVGALVIVFSVLVPMMPGMSMEGMMGGPDIPPGWTYCPSTWAQRMPIIILGVVGFLIARQLAAYQLGHASSVWDPFFSGLSHGRNGTESIITSSVSKAWPIPDGGLGAVSYMLEILMGAMGDKRRWRTMPWMVTFFGILVVPLGTVSIYFIIIQPIVIGTWCSLCLLAALAMVIMIPFALDELVAMGQFLVWSKRAGKSFWRMFLTGGALEGGTEDKEVDLKSPGATITAAIRGMTVPWTLVASAILGLWFMFTRLTFSTIPPMANSDHLVGALIVTVAIIAMAEVARPIRFINVLFGGWLVVAPFVLAGTSPVGQWSATVLGIVLIILSLPRGVRSKDHYANWDRFVF